MHKQLATVLCPVLLIAFQQGPVVHFHQDDHAKEHVEAEHTRGLAAHIHFGSNSLPSDEHGGPRAAPVGGDEDPVEISWLQSERPEAPHAESAAGTLGSSVSPVVVVLANPPQEPRIHDPPFTSSRIPRAPPT